MHAHKAFRAILFTFLLTVGSFLPILGSQPVGAQPTQGNTTLYFTNILNFLINENLTEFAFAPLSVDQPTSLNDSFYPPNLFEMNTSKLLPHKQFSNQWLTWFTTAWLIYFLQGTEGFNFSDILQYFGNGSFNGYDISLLLPNPMRVVESYTYNGEAPVTINGDLSFNLYFMPPKNRLPKYRDNVTVSLYSINMNSLIPLPKLIKNTSITLKSSGSGIYNQLVTLQNISHTLTPGASLLFSVEIFPANKIIPNWLSKKFDLTKWEKRANFLENRSHLPTIKKIGTTIKQLLADLRDAGINITPQDIDALLNSVVSTKFVYDSLVHPSSVSVPAVITDEDIRLYYLQAGQVMSETLPTGASTSRVKLSTTPVVWTTDQALERNKMLQLKNTTVEMYLYRIPIIIRPKLTMVATLYDNGTLIATSEKKITPKEVQSLIRKPKDPVIFVFTGSAIEINNGHRLGLGISLGNGTKFVIPKVSLQYGSSAYPASLRVKYEETHNIKVHDVIVIPENGKIIPGGSVKYLLNISSVRTDTLLIRTIEREKLGAWNVSAPETATVNASSMTKIPVVINSMDPFKTAYNNKINVTLVITGKTGKATTSASAEVTRDAIQYSVVILDYQHKITMKKGETRNFYFIIKNNNTGAIDDVDNYTVAAVSKNGWQVIPRESIKNIHRGDTSPVDDARVVIEIPKNTTLQSDLITVTITSDTNPSTSTSINFTVDVQPPDILESIYDSFSSAARSLGLSDIFGDYAAIALASLIMIIILFIILILAFVLTLKDVTIICTDRIREIEPGQLAVFELSLKNPTKKQQSYEVKTQHTGEPSQWTIQAEPATVQVEGRQRKPVRILATPAETIMPKDWTEITVLIHKIGRKKNAHIALMAMIKEGKTVLQIGNVTHWPSEFNPGDRVVTSFSISNKGTIVARHVVAFLYINGKQRNKIATSIPAGAIADVQMPWIAMKGKNKVRIRLQE